MRSRIHGLNSAFLMAPAISVALLYVPAANAVPLSHLLAGESLTVLDKEFTDWELIGDDTLDLTAIDVTGLDDQQFNPGLKFTSLEPFPLSASDGDFVNLSFRFSVVAPEETITAAALDLVSFSTTGDAGISVFQDVLDDTEESLAINLVFADAVSQSTADSTSFVPQMVLTVETSIVLATGDIGDNSATLEVFEQRFFQIEREIVVSEPASLALLGIGLAGIAFAGRRVVMSAR